MRKVRMVVSYVKEFVVDDEATKEQELDRAYEIARDNVGCFDIKLERL